MHFTFSHYGQEALSANLSFTLDADVVPNETGNAGSSGGGLTMVLLVGSVFFFSSQTAMYEFLQPKVAAALQEKGLYDPEAEGPCPGMVNNTHQGAAAATAEEEEASLAMKEEESGNSNVITALSRKSRSRSRRRVQEASFAPAADTPSSPLSPPLLVDFPTCDDVIKAFNTDQGTMGQDATDYAFLYMCNITASHAIDKADMVSSSPPSPPERHHLSYDQLRPADYPYSYWVFLNINPPTPSPSSSLGDSLAASALSQTISYEASFFPVYVPATAKLMDPFFVVLVLAVGLYFVIFCRYVINPLLDCLSSTRWGKRCLRRSSS